MEILFSKITNHLKREIERFLLMFSRKEKKHDSFYE